MKIFINDNPIIQSFKLVLIVALMVLAFVPSQAQVAKQTNHLQLPILNNTNSKASEISYTTTYGNNYLLGSPDNVLNNDGWGLSSKNLASFRAAILNASNFGDNGTVNKAIAINDLSTIDSTNLSGLDGFMEAWWNNTQSAPYVRVIIEAFLRGMDLWLLEDDGKHNGIGTALGILATDADGSPTNGSSPLFSGPFGTADNVLSFGNFAQFNPDTIVSLGGIAIGQNTTGEVTVAIWPKGAYAPGSGAILLFSDIDMISNWQQDPFTPLNSNGKLALNSMAWLANGGTLSSKNISTTGKSKRFELHQNYPNPFNPSTLIRYQLPVSSLVKLEVFDLLGRKVATLANERKAAGSYQATFNASNLASGIYFYKLQAGSFLETKKMMLVK